MNAINNQVLERRGMNTEVVSFLIVLKFEMFQLLSSINVMFSKKAFHILFIENTTFILELCLYYVTTNNQNEFFKNKISLGFFLNRKANEFWIQKYYF